MTDLKLSEIEFGGKDTGYALILEVVEKTTRTGKPYVEVKITDGETEAVAKKWDTPKAAMLLYEKKPALLTVSCKSYNGMKDFTIEDCKAPKDDVKMSDFIRKAPLESDYMYDEIIKAVESVSDGTDGSLSALVKNIYEDNKEKLFTWGAASGVHHNFYGGLLYHTYRMVKLAEAMLPIYDLDAELLLSATALHDIGKLKELDTDEFGESTYSIDGQLFGHALLGIEMIDEEAGKHEYNADRIRCIKHCIASHHGHREWGAVSLPMIEEAMVLHLIDMMDSRIQIFDQNKAGIEPGSVSEEKIRALDGVSIYIPE